MGDISLSSLQSIEFSEAHFSYIYMMFGASSELLLGDLETCTLVKIHSAINVRGFRFPSVIQKEESTFGHSHKLFICFSHWPHLEQRWAWMPIEDQK